MIKLLLLLCCLWVSTQALPTFNKILLSQEATAAKSPNDESDRRFRRDSIVDDIEDVDITDITADNEKAGTVEVLWRESRDTLATTPSSDPSESFNSTSSTIKPVILTEPQPQKTATSPSQSSSTPTTPSPISFSMKKQEKQAQTQKVFRQYMTKKAATVTFEPVDPALLVTPQPKRAVRMTTQWDSTKIALKITTGALRQQTGSFRGRRRKTTPVPPTQHRSENKPSITSLLFTTTTTPVMKQRVRINKAKKLKTPSLLTTRTTIAPARTNNVQSNVTPSRSKEQQFDRIQLDHIARTTVSVSVPTSNSNGLSITTSTTARGLVDGEAGEPLIDGEVHIVQRKHKTRSFHGRKRAVVTQHKLGSVRTKRQAGEKEERIGETTIDPLTQEFLDELQQQHPEEEEADTGEQSVNDDNVDNKDEKTELIEHSPQSNSNSKQNSHTRVLQRYFTKKGNALVDYENVEYNYDYDYEPRFPLVVQALNPEQIWWAPFNRQKRSILEFSNGPEIMEPSAVSETFSSATTTPASTASFNFDEGVPTSSSFDNSPSLTDITASSAELIDSLKPREDLPDDFPAVSLESFDKVMQPNKEGETTSSSVESGTELVETTSDSTTSTTSTTSSTTTTTTTAITTSSTVTTTAVQVDPEITIAPPAEVATTLKEVSTTTESKDLFTVPPPSEEELAEEQKIRSAQQLKNDNETEKQRKEEEAEKQRQDQSRFEEAVKTQAAIDSEKAAQLTKKKSEQFHQKIAVAASNVQHEKTEPPVFVGKFVLKADEKTLERDVAKGINPTEKDTVLVEADVGHLEESQNPTQLINNVQKALKNKPLRQRKKFRGFSHVKDTVGHRDTRAQNSVPLQQLPTNPAPAERVFPTTIPSPTDKFLISSATVRDRDRSNGFSHYKPPASKTALEVVEIVNELKRAQAGDKRPQSFSIFTTSKQSFFILPNGKVLVIAEESKLAKHKMDDEEDRPDEAPRVKRRQTKEHPLEQEARQVEQQTRQQMLNQFGNNAALEPLPVAPQPTSTTQQKIPVFPNGGQSGTFVNFNQQPAPQQPLNIAPPNQQQFANYNTQQFNPAPMQQINYPQNQQNFQNYPPQPFYPQDQMRQQQFANNFYNQQQRPFYPQQQQQFNRPLPAQDGVVPITFPTLIHEDLGNPNVIVNSGRDGKTLLKLVTLHRTKVVQMKN